MPRNDPFVVTFLFVLLVAATADAQKRIGERFELGVGQSVRIVDAGFRVGFQRVVSDSRCPRGVECIWEGDAAARVWAATSRLDRKFFKLHTNPGFRTEGRFLGFAVRLLQVDPYPEDGVIIDPNDYRVTMVVVRLEQAAPVEASTWGAIKELYK